MPAQNPVIVVPGITATGLRDEYPINAERVWTLLEKAYDRVALHPDDLRYELAEPARVVPDEIWSLPYGEFIAELRHDLSPRADQPTPVYPFPYDWRQPLVQTQARLAAFVDEVIARTRLLRHYNTGDPSWADDPYVDLVGHSMGGLIIAGYLSEHGDEARVGRVASLGSPFRGSMEAVLKLATGEGAPGGERTSQRDRETARLTPAVYHLLPSFEGALEPTDGLPASIFDPENMQPGAWKSIGEAIRLHAPDKRNRNTRAKGILQTLLDQARAHRASLEDPDLLHNAGLAHEDWLCVVGVDEPTRTRVRIARSGGSARYDLDSMARRNEWGNSDPLLRVHTGDGTVPYLGAKPPFLPCECLVLVTDDDFDFFGEFADRVIEGRGGLHGLLPKMNLVQRLVTSHLKGSPFGKVWGRAAPDLPEGAAWSPPIRNLRAC
jgi:pimeloyl-ACP methyl ester carboxylesterase